MYRFTSKTPLLRSSRGGLNLIPSIPSDALESIRSLPESSQALDVLTNGQIQTDIQTVECLKRASEIFHQFNPNGEEVKAILILKSQAFSEMGSYTDSTKVLDSLLKMKLTEEQYYDVSLAKVKMLWFDGSFEDASGSANELCNFAPQMASRNVQLYQGLALNALAICRLSFLDLKDVHMMYIRKSKGKDKCPSYSSKQLQEAEDAKAMMKMASAILRNSFLEESSGGNPMKHHQLGLAAAASFINQGTAELMRTIIKSQLVGMNLPYDQALISYREAMNILDKFDEDIVEHRTSFHRALAYSNMAWTILFASSYMNKELGSEKLSEEDLRLASTYAGEALKIHDAMIKNNSEGLGNEYHSMGRALSLVASCYARTGSAVTAEGLLHSAMDYCGTSSNPLCILDSRSSVLNYSQLCSKWENRGADREVNESLATNIDAELPLAWRGKSSLYSGMCFTSMGDLRH